MLIAGKGQDAHVYSATVVSVDLGRWGQSTHVELAGMPAAETAAMVATVGALGNSEVELRLDLRRRDESESQVYII
jgi:hypothetical protein